MLFNLLKRFLVNISAYHKHIASLQYVLQPHFKFSFTYRKKKHVQWETMHPFYATGLFLYPLKIWENQRFLDVSWGYRRRSVAWNGLTPTNKNRTSLQVSVTKLKTWAITFYNYIHIDIRSTFTTHSNISDGAFCENNLQV